MTEDEKALLEIAQILAERKGRALSKLRLMEKAAEDRVEGLQIVRSDARGDPNWMTRPLAGNWSAWASKEIEKTNLSIARIRAQMPVTEHQARLAFGRRLALEDVLNGLTSR